MNKDVSYDRASQIAAKQLTRLNSQRNFIEIRFMLPQSKSRSDYACVNIQCKSPKLTLSFKKLLTADELQTQTRLEAAQYGSLVPSRSVGRSEQAERSARRTS
jgi:hypothetical protein